LEGKVLMAEFMEVLVVPLLEKIFVVLRLDDMDFFFSSYIFSHYFFLISSNFSNYFFT
jgi:hypothetical protein